MNILRFWMAVIGVFRSSNFTYTSVNRKTIVNAKLSEAKDSISAKKAIDFLKSKARNRWTNDDEKGDPIGLKLLHSFKEFKFRENFYPSVSKFELD